MLNNIQILNRNGNSASNVYFNKLNSKKKKTTEEHIFCDLVISKNTV